MEEVICRGCLGKDGIFHSFERKYVLDMFSNCTGLPVVNGNQPNQICSSCLNNCQRWDEFRRLCYLSDQKLSGFDCLNKTSTEDNYNNDSNICWIKSPAIDEDEDEAHSEVVVSEAEGEGAEDQHSDYEAEEEQEGEESTEDSFREKNKAKIQKERLSEEYHCNQCDKIYKRKISFEKHLKAHEKRQMELKQKNIHKKDTVSSAKTENVRKSKSLVCDECGETFNHLLALQKHKLAHQLGITKPIKNVDKLLESNKDVLEDTTLPNSWTAKRRKKLKDAGLPYYNGAGELIMNKTEFKFFDCKCRRKCASTLGIEDRRRLFDEFQQKDYKEKRIFVVNSIDSQHVERRRSLGPSRRQFTLVYRLATKKICKSAYVTTLGLTPGFIDKCMNLSRQNRDFGDMRGKYKKKSLPSSD